MSDTPAGNGETPAPNPQADQPSLRVLAQYLKDHSFENPRAPQSFVDSPEPPAIEVNVDVSGRSLGNDQYEVELSISARATRQEQVSFVAEVTYAGVFEIKNVPNDQMEPLMLVECPRLLFPFIRQIIADTTLSGNFPPVMLDPIDFLSVYQQRKAREAAGVPNA